MIPIYICDDDKIMLKEIEDIIKKCIITKGYDMNVVYSLESADDLLSCINFKKNSGIYFLDFDLKHSSLDGFTLGEKIRNLDPMSFIIYITAYPDFAFKTFEYHIEAMDYIVKGNLNSIEKDIERCLETIFIRSQERFKDSQDRYYIVKLSDEMKYIKMSEIIYFETSSRSHYIILHSHNEIIEFLSSLNDIQKSLDSYFIRVHKSFLVNSKKILKFSLRRLELTLYNGNTCIVSRKMKKQLIAFMQNSALPLEK